MAKPMTKLEIQENLAAEQRVALAYMQGKAREMLAGAFAFDRRLARIVAHAGEPLLAQMRLAWWRDNLSKPVSGRPAGDLVLDALSRQWPDWEDALQLMLDGWELLLGEGPLSDNAARQFAEGRTAVFIAVAFAAGCERSVAAVEQAARRWAFADAAAHSANRDERALLIALGKEDGLGPGRLPGALRGLAVLDALASRALNRGGTPLMDGRGAAMCALRVGLLGR